jgi:hypothetical protein
MQVRGLDIGRRIFYRLCHRLFPECILVWLRERKMEAV